MNLIENIQKFLSIDTTPEAGTLEGGLWLKSIATSFKLDVEIDFESFQEREQANVFIRPQRRMGPEFLLQGHYDTINPGSSSLWTETNLNPFQPIIKDGQLYGLGACEAKVDLMCKLEALRALQQQESWKITPVVVANFGGEIGMQGLLRSIRKNRVSGVKALVGEPSDGDLIYAGKGYALIEMTIPFSDEEKEYRREHDLQESVRTQTKIFKSIPRHSAIHSHSENAINKAFEYLWQIPDGVVLMDIDGGSNPNTIPDYVALEFDICGGVKDPMVLKLRRVYQALQKVSSEFLIFGDSAFKISNPTLNMGKVNTFDDHVKIVCSFRFPPLVDDIQYQKWLKELREGTTMVGGDCSVRDYKRPYRTDLNSDFVKECKDVLSSLGRSSKVVALPVCTEMSLLSRIGVECLGFGIGARKEIGSVASDSISIENLRWSSEFYRKLIKKVCL